MLTSCTPSTLTVCCVPLATMASRCDPEPSGATLPNWRFAPSARNCQPPVGRMRNRYPSLCEPLAADFRHTTPIHSSSSATKLVTVTSTVSVMSLTV